MTKADRDEILALAERLRSLLEARRDCSTEAAAGTFTHEIGMLVAGEPEVFLAALRAHAAKENDQ